MCQVPSGSLERGRNTWMADNSLWGAQPWSWPLLHGSTLVWDYFCAAGGISRGAEPSDIRVARNTALTLRMTWQHLACYSITTYLMVQGRDFWELLCQVRLSPQKRVQKAPGASQHFLDGCASCITQYLTNARAIVPLHIYQVGQVPSNVAT